MFPGGQGRLPVGADQQGGDAGLVDQRLPDLLAVEERLQRRTVEDFLGPVGLDRGRAVELQRPAGHVQDQVAAEQPVLRVLDDGQKPQSRLGLSVDVCPSSSRRFHPCLSNMRIFPHDASATSLPSGASGVAGDDFRDSGESAGEARLW